MEKETQAPLDCSICYELLTNALETCCGHAFCEYCINKVLENSEQPTCPLCRQNPTPIHPSYTLRRLVEQERVKRGISSKMNEDHCNISMNKLQHLGSVAYRRGQYAEAIKYFSDGITHYPTAIFYGNRAACYFKLKRYKTALDDYEMAEKTEHDNIKIVMGKAFTLEKLKEYDLSYNYFQHALGIAVCSKDLTCQEDILEGINRILKHTSFTLPTSTITTTTTTTIKDTTTTTKTETTINGRLFQKPELIRDVTAISQLDIATNLESSSLQGIYDYVIANQAAFFQEFFGS